MKNRLRAVVACRRDALGEAKAALLVALAEYQDAVNDIVQRQEHGDQKSGEPPNPNVLFELGMRIAENKPVVLVRATGTGRIFDVDHVLRIQDYSPNLWTSTVANDLPLLQAHIKAGWENRDSVDTYRNILLGATSAVSAA